METILAMLVGSVLGPFVTAALKRLSWVDAQLGSAINLGVNVLAYVVAWWLIGGADRALLEQYLLWGLGAGGVGSAANNVWRKRFSA